MMERSFLSTECVNLNKHDCPFTESPEKILSMFKDPENFPFDDVKAKELNDQCSGCEWFKRKEEAPAGTNKG